MSGTAWDAAAGSLTFTAPAVPGGPRFLWRLNGATLVLDLKRRMGSPDATNTAYGPTTNTSARELAISHGATAGDVPPASSTYRANAQVPAGVLRVLAWLAYLQPLGVPLSAVTLDGLARGLTWGVRAPGGRVEVTRTPVDGGAAVSVLVPAIDALVSQVTGTPATQTEQTAGAGSSSGSSAAASGRSVVMPGPWHLRTIAQASSAGARAMPGGERVELLSQAPAAMVRGNGERGYRVRLPDGTEGFAFVPVSTLQAVGVAVADLVADVVGNTAGTVVSGSLKVAGGLLLATLVAGGAAFAWSRRSPSSAQGNRPAMVPPAPSRSVPATRYAPAMEASRSRVPPTEWDWMSQGYGGKPTPAAPPAGLVAPSRGASNGRRFPRVGA